MFRTLWSTVILGVSRTMCLELRDWILVRSAMNCLIWNKLTFLGLSFLICKMRFKFYNILWFSSWDLSVWLIPNCYWVLMLSVKSQSWYSEIRVKTQDLCLIYAKRYVCVLTTFMLSFSSCGTSFDFKHWVVCWTALETWPKQ